MRFSTHNIVRSQINPLYDEMATKALSFSPLVFCEFFQGMEVLQVKGEETNEYIFGVYAGGRLVGTLYFGHLYTENQLQQIRSEYFPELWDQISNYENEKSGVWYSKLDPSQYAFVLENPNIIKKIS